MKKHLLFIGALALSAMLMVGSSSCSSGGGSEPEIPEVPEPEVPGEPSYEYLHYVKEIRYTDDSEVYTFDYNDDYTLSKVTQNKSGSEATLEFTYDDGNITRIKNYAGDVLTLTHSGNTITVVNESEMYGTINGTLTLNDEGQLVSGWFEQADWDFNYSYTGNRLTGKTGGGVVYSSLEYDSKNPVAHAEMLPEWVYFMNDNPATACPIMPFSYFLLNPWNNIVKMTGSDTVEILIEYNDYDYPIEMASTDGVQSITITYDIVEVEITDDEE